MTPSQSLCTFAARKLIPAGWVSGEAVQDRTMLLYQPHLRLCVETDPYIAWLDIHADKNPKDRLLRRQGITTVRVPVELKYSEYYAHVYDACLYRLLDIMERMDRDWWPYGDPREAPWFESVFGAAVPA